LNSGNSQPAKRSTDHDWLPQSPSPVFARLTGWVVIALFTGAFLAAVTIQIPETVRCRFRLIPEAGSDPIQTPVQGTLHRVFVQEGSEVEAGTALFEIRSEEVLTWQTELRTAREDLRAGTESAVRNEESHQALLRIKEAERLQVEEELQFRRRHRDTVTDLVRRTRELRTEGLVSEVEMLRAELELADADKDLNVAGQALQRLASELARMESDRSRQRSEEHASTEKRKHSIDTLQLRLAAADGAVLTIRSPQRAVVVSIAQHSPGSVVLPGQELCQLARTDDRPIAELQLHQHGLDRIAAGQESRLFFDAFPYQRYGTLSARIDWLSPASIAAGDQSGFRARARLDHFEFQRAAQPLPVRAGMVGEARIRIGRRTLMESAFEPLRALREQTR